MGETGQIIRSRLNGHFFKINNSNSSNKIGIENDQEVADHFNQIDHKFVRDFFFTVIRSGLTNSNYRFAFETEYIHFFLNIE